MPRLIIIVLIAGVGARAVTVPDQGSAAAAVDLENEQRHDVFDDALDDADALLAPDHAAGLRAELGLMKEVLEEQKSVLDSLESTAAAVVLSAGARCRRPSTASPRRRSTPRAWLIWHSPRSFDYPFLW